MPPQSPIVLVLMFLKPALWVRSGYGFRAKIADMTFLGAMIINKKKLFASKPLYNIPPIVKIRCGNHQPPAPLENPATLAQKKFGIEQMLY